MGGRSEELPKALKNIVDGLGWPLTRYLPDSIRATGFYALLKKQILFSKNYYQRKIKKMKNI